jgi:nicotinamidase/pyrazinamidase
MEEKSRMAYTLLCIDPQIDFHEGGSLAVKGATEDSNRLIQLITSKPPAKTVVSLDTHTPNHIGHAAFWEDASGNNPSPFTTLLIKECSVDGTGIIYATKSNSQEITAYTPVNKNLTKWANYYVKHLPDTGRAQMFIWPNHCIEGTDGHLVYRPLKEAFDNLHLNVQYHMKGQNEATEMYSIFAAELPVEENAANGAPADLYTGRLPNQESGLSTTADVVSGSYLKTDDNNALVDYLAERDLPIVVCGQALSHCVNWSTRDLKRLLGTRQNKIILLSDCSSAVGGFEKQADALLEWCTANEVNVMTAADFQRSLDGGRRRRSTRHSGKRGTKRSTKKASRRGHKRA